MNVFSAAMDRIYANPSMAAVAVWISVIASEEIPIRVIRRAPDRITGHSLKDVGAILDAHYLSRDSRMAESALKKREAHEAGTKVPN